MTPPVVLLLLLVPLASPLVASPSPCEGHPAVAALIEKAFTNLESDDSSRSSLEAGIELIEDALQEHPEAVLLHRARQDLYSTGDEGPRRIETLRQSYARSAEDSPKDPAAQYLSGRIAESLDDQEAAFAAALALDPQFPWGHLGLASVAQQRGAGHEEALVHHLGRFADLCPDRVGNILAYELAPLPPDFWRPRLPSIREQLIREAGREPKEFLRLWRLEFRSAEVDQHPEVRERIRGDLAALASIESPSPELLQIRLEGWELVGDQGRAAALREELHELEPCGRSAVDALVEGLAQEWGIPRLVPLRGEERRRAFREIRTATEKWIAGCPEEYSFWSPLLLAVRGLGDEVEDAELLRIGRRFVEVYEAAEVHSSPTAFEDVAAAYIDRGLAPRDALSLLDRAEDAATARWTEEDLSDVPEERRDDIAAFRRHQIWTRNLLRARGQIQLDEIAKATAVLERAEKELAEMAPAAEAIRHEVQLHRARSADHLAATAELALAEGRTADALAFLVASEEVDPGPLPPYRWSFGDRSAQISELWRALGGSDRGLVALRRSESSAPDEPRAESTPSNWEPAEGSLPEFELPDLRGELWTLEDLSGKAVLINAWAVWCGPCHAELPAIQLLHERIRDRDDVLVVTMDMDHDRGVVAPWVEKNGYTFPVLFAAEYLSRDLGVTSIPRSWILDPVGALRWTQSGYDASQPPEAWVDEVLAKIDALAE